jgi:hypothetical protein
MDEVVPVFFAQGATEVPSGTWTVDSVHSVASFAVRHMMVGTFRGEFSEIDATLTDGKLIGKVKVETSRPACSHLTSLTSSSSRRSSTSRPHSRSTTASLAARVP